MGSTRISLDIPARNNNGRKILRGRKIHGCPTPNSNSKSHRTALLHIIKFPNPTTKYEPPNHVLVRPRRHTVGLPGCRPALGVCYQLRILI
ncbi:hypothetical protein L484_025848 [Morus notabilis]|uniref:Uncharacterized protein n=1 Tax=Morus notabilis TaxID=981085 RepID=W9R2N9_9ROSA|nr:hypothetical protein L484_025848 [Morus notabilis]